MIGSSGCTQTDAHAQNIAPPRAFMSVVITMARGGHMRTHTAMAESAPAPACTVCRVTSCSRSTSCGSQVTHRSARVQTSSDLCLVPACRSLLSDACCATPSGGGRAPPPSSHAAPASNASKPCVRMGGSGVCGGGGSDNESPRFELDNEGDALVEQCKGGRCACGTAQT